MNKNHFDEDIHLGNNTDINNFLLIFTNTEFLFRTKDFDEYS